MKRALFLLCLLSASITLADRTCSWHRSNPASAGHYAAYHDRDGDGVGCEVLSRRSSSSHTSSTSSTSSSGSTTTSISTPTVTPTVEPVVMATPTPTASATAPSTVTIRLLYNSNFRARPGIENSIVGGGLKGNTYTVVQTADDNAGNRWYQLRLPYGWGWVRSDLAEDAS